MALLPDAIKLRDFRRMDFSLIFLCGVLLLTSCLFIYGAGQQIGADFESYWIRQLVAIALGSIFFVFVSAIDYRLLGRWSWLLFGFAITLLVLVLFVGVEVNAARSWLPIPVIGVLFQPAELGKPAVLVFVAWLTSYLKYNVQHDLACLFALAAGVLPAVLIGFQPDWGTALAYLPPVLTIVFISGIRWRWLMAGAAILLICAPVGYHYLLGERQQERITSFISPGTDVADTGWTAHQSMLAVGSGGVSGKGYMQGTQHVLGYLPQNVAPTDFIFSVIAEETGFLGAGGLVCAFTGVLLCALRTALVASDRFGMMLSAGIAALVFTHVYINIGMTILMSPVIGIPLPFISYGGSFMLSMMICIGLLQSVYMRR